MNNEVQVLLSISEKMKKKKKIHEKQAFSCALQSVTIPAGNTLFYLYNGRKEVGGSVRLISPQCAKSGTLGT